MSLLVAGGSFNEHRILLRGCGTIDSDDIDELATTGLMARANA